MFFTFCPFTTYNFESISLPLKGYLLCYTWLSYSIRMHVTSYLALLLSFIHVLYFIPVPCTLCYTWSYFSLTYLSFTLTHLSYTWSWYCFIPVLFTLHIWSYYSVHLFLLLLLYLLVLFPVSPVSFTISLLYPSFLLCMPVLFTPFYTFPFTPCYMSRYFL